MKLLLDQNLPPRLCSLLADLFPGSVHVRDVTMSAASDEEIWEYAKTHDFIIVSKDSSTTLIRVYTEHLATDQ